MIKIIKKQALLILLKECWTLALLKLLEGKLQKQYQNFGTIWRESLAVGKFGELSTKPSFGKMKFDNLL